jgi:hypothetical protein
MTMFIDGTGITPGSEKCCCTPECDFPCWQRLGLGPACEFCGCPPFPEALAAQPPSDPNGGTT